MLKARRADPGHRADSACLS